MKNHCDINSSHSGEKNITADYLSRAFSDSTEWKLNERVFQKICKTLFYPDKDLFAFRLKKTQLDMFLGFQILWQLHMMHFLFLGLIIVV